MKTTLTAEDAAGWYEFKHDDRRRSAWWNGEDLLIAGKSFDLLECSNISRLFTEAEVAELRKELATNEALVAESIKGAEQVNEELKDLREFHAYATGRIRLLEAEVDRLKSSPYVMRKADKPDCEGIWMNGHGDCNSWRDHEINNPICKWKTPPYFYLGPIPVVPREQLPPKVVKVRHKETGEEARAIPSAGDSLAIIHDNGSYRGTGLAEYWEVIQ